MCGLIRLAYDVRPEQIVGPAWIREANASVIYAVDARAPQDVPLTQAVARQMIRVMLTDRFVLRVHWSQADINVYNLVTSRRGVRLDKPDPKVCPEGSLPEGVSAIFAMGPSVVSRCAPPATMKEFADDLSSHVDRPVVDETGIDGAHTYSLRWATEGAPNPLGLPGLFTAIEEQMGLRLEAAKSMSPMLAIDQVERPSPD